MHFRARQLLLASLIVLYGTLNAIGPGLHLLNGMGHAAKALATADPSDSSRLTHPAHDDCSLCQFFTQGAVASDPARLLSLEVVQIKPDDALPPLFPLSLPRTSAPRAPPLGSTLA